jgi:GDSL-like lipase/acylhydrolase family protein
MHAPPVAARPVRIALAVVGAILAIALAAQAATAAPLRYVALGDSYSAADTGDFAGSQYPGVAPQIRDTTYPSLVKALAAVEARAPKARVAILGYPWIMPASGGCFDKMPVAEGDVPYVRGIQATLNDAVRRAAAATGATYVDFSVVSDGHDACQPIGVRWIEPVLQGTNPVIVHPNALGESKMAAQAIEVLRLR